MDRTVRDEIKRLVGTIRAIPHQQFVFGDGSVRAVSNSIDTVILGYLANRKDGHPIPGDVLR